MPHDEIGWVGEYTLAQRAKQGDWFAFDKLVRAHDQSILRLALHLCDSKYDAQELYEQVFLTAYKGLAAFRVGSSFRFWLYRILSRLLTNYSTKNTRNRSSSVSADTNYEQRETAAQEGDEESGHAKRESVEGAEADRIRLALRNLDRTEWIVFELRHYAGLRLRTIAEILQVSETTVTTTFCRATRNLRHTLAIPCKVRDQQSIVSVGPKPAGEKLMRNSARVAKDEHLKRE
jgi:RNA polymerase sigma-70 factor, ECF subfamily